MSGMQQHDETAAVAERYARRQGNVPDYSMLAADVWSRKQELERALIAGLNRRAIDPAATRLLEVGCGSGGNLLDLLRLGFLPEHLAGAELLPERVAEARSRLPEVLQLIAGDALAADFAPASFDIVYQSTVFTSLLDDDFQLRLAEAMWNWLKPGGTILWYDFAFDNPRNPDVRGVPLARIRQLFPHGQIDSRRITLAPPLARPLCRLHPSLYTLFNLVPLLRTHRLCWIGKPA